MSTSESPKAEAPCRVLIDYSKRVNFAFQQNSIPVLKRMEIENNTEHDWHHIKCHLNTQPAWAEPYTLEIAVIPAGTTYVLIDIPLNLDIEYLAKLSERVLSELRTEIWVSDTAGSQDENLDLKKIHEQVCTIDVYAYDEWVGLRSLPEILGAFVTPNLSVIEQLLSNATQLLSQRTSSSALDGYQANSKKRVYEIIDAIYDALREQEICYSNPPASFENTGQRIRFGSRIIKSKLGTCLDLSLLFASTLEQAGLNPLVLIHQGHAYVGCWLVNDSFCDPATDDLQSIRKRNELEELLVFESTLACDGSKADFKQAIDAAQQHLTLDDVFEYAIDIFRCRSARISPLPLERNEGDVDIQKAREVHEPKGIPSKSRAQDVQFKDDLTELNSGPESPQGRIDHWKQNLLDLTLRNRLLNFKETKQTIPILCPHPEHMEDELAADQTFQVLEQTPLMAGIDPRSFSLQVSQTGEDPVVEHLTRELYAKRLRSSLTQQELSRRLLELYRRNRIDNEESGANTLFLAFGFLEWKQNKDDERSFRAPLLLVPVQLNRKSVQSGFCLERHDEDTLVNVTLLELLKRDYELEVPGVNPPPEDDSGVDVDKVFRLFQHAVRDLSGWEVHREVWLAQFSFSKFLLWKDLNDRADILSKNPVVNHLMHHPGQPFLDELDGLEPKDLDDAVGFEKIYCPMSSDSSQLAAILAAAKGKNFVMNGPPGTGKSQTIANIIAHCLAEGKRVLFVAEKRAALNVVHHRLGQIGLSPFCLELHSNKSGKAEVLRQFEEAITYVEQHPTDEWETLAQRLNNLRDELNNHVRELHKIYPNKLTAYHCYTWLISHAELCKKYAIFDRIDIPDLENHPQHALEELQETCEQLILRGSERHLSATAKEILHPVKATEWTPEWEDEVFASSTDLLGTIQALRPLWADVASKIGFPVASASTATLDGVVKLTASLCNSPQLPALFITEPNWTTFKSDAESWIASGRQRDLALANLDGFNIDALWEIDTQTLENSYNAIAEKGGIFKSLKHWKLLRPIRLSRKAGATKWMQDTAPAFFETIRLLKSQQANLNAAKEEATAHFGSFWNAETNNWDHLQELLEYGDELQTHIKQLAGDSVELLTQIRNRVGDLINTGTELLQDGEALYSLFQRYESAKSAYSEAALRFQETLTLEPPETENNILEQTEHFCNQLSEQRNYLAAWCRWQNAYQKADERGLSILLHALNSGTLSLGELRAAFEYAYHNSFLKRLLTLSPILRDFYGEEHQKRIDAFRDFDERYIKLTGQIVAARLAGRLPRARSEECPRNTELGMIQREMVKRRRHKPVRKLLAETPGVSPRLKPCFLMSPLSVAQYLDAEESNFDVVVFDEASQIPVWDSIGAIARGNQVIVVGDPKQLPPTNFFSRVDHDDGFVDDNQVEDLESILDECLGSGLKVHHLLWHYRSRKEGLIAFSNYHYYNNELHTFPSPHTENIGVSLVPVPDGFYDKGKSRTNKAEARAIVQDVLRRLSDATLSKMSIGIVTFSQAQQTLILDLLDELRRNHPEFEPHFCDETNEPVFVKNLENVQGDERDVILFSICYGPDQAGKLSMNFGPLNRDGGERRLNVAVTRAKHEVMIFSTLRSEQIDLSRTRATGAAHLKSYLEYAERGPASIAANIESARADDYDSVFEKEVAEFLRSKGYTVHTQIGCSGYRIDLGIVDPNAPGNYLLGIECDGATYHSAATARDRDRLRQAVLEGLGWRIYRIWSTDWWRNATVAKEDLLAEVEFVLNLPIEKAPTVISAEPAEEDVELHEETYASNAGKPVAEIEKRKQDYPQITLKSYSPSDTFYSPKGQKVIQKQIQRIIENEGPITEHLITRRIAQEWGFTRVASKIKEIVQNNLPDQSKGSTQAGNITYWPNSIEPKNYRMYRSSSSEDRKFEDVPMEELCNAALDILEKYITFPKENFAAEIARCFGFSRVTKPTALIGESAIQTLLSRQIITTNGTDYQIADTH